MGSIFALAENYPQLRASENMARLQEELSTTENTIAFARQAYNDQVLAYNTAQQKCRRCSLPQLSAIARQICTRSRRKRLKKP